MQVHSQHCEYTYREVLSLGEEESSDSLLSLSLNFSFFGDELDSEFEDDTDVKLLLLDDSGDVISMRVIESRTSKKKNFFL